MNESIELNLTNAEQSFVEEDIAEANDSQTIDPVLNKPKNSLPQKGEPVLIAGGGTNPPPPPDPEFSSEIEISSGIIV
ncbi:hypothetical protein IQ276_028870 [Desmonostoc muscorum LEGE 12446]|uniref:Uncharacterized protein n=1 Tax=Desmonostoc muscorum LEGE 12446 TaxID=1828758 RepID=A0A8J7D1G3_DESMC|nr:hypothetical protein [Desmonostoc muscorum]MCF2150372.1 hypothetical protein [Desmonostoc muscorum LEGE 12446]